MRMDINYWSDMVVANRKRVEELNSKCNKVWDYINEIVQQLNLLDFVYVDDFTPDVEVKK